MVYQGPSRGCISCRIRRKKCDETRPSCIRCSKAGRVCHGYEIGTSIKYEVQDIDHISDHSIARKCSLPKRAPIPGTNILTKDAIPVERSEEESNWLSFRAFLHDFTIMPTNRNLSRGYFSELEMLARRLGPTSDLVKACQTVGFASHGKLLRRPQLVNKSERFYQDLLGSFAKTIGDSTSVDTTELRLVATLLGLHQIIAANAADPGNHTTHAKGLAALMNIECSPLGLLNTAQIPGLFSLSATRSNDESLEDLLLTLNLLWQTLEGLVECQSLSTIKTACIALDARFARWQISRILEFNPATIGYVKGTFSSFSVPVGCWPGKVDTYLDLYIAGVWNIFRVARLLLIDLIVRVSVSLMDEDSYDDLIAIATEMAGDVAASVPYHLVDNLPSFLNNLESGLTEISDPGRLLGGLILMHPLYIASKMPFLSANIRAYMRACLGWIGAEMGLGQAALLATDPGIDAYYVANSCMIIWSGFIG